jgi:PAS domain S-box-containing protein
MSRPVHTLLLVEDAPSDRQQYRCYLAADILCTYHILEADSAAAGLALCVNQSIDAILLDGDLPDANELEFLAALSATSGAHPPIVVVADGNGTALTQAIQAIKSGAEDYLLKHSLTPERLQTAVRSAIENTRLRLELQQCDDRRQQTEAALHQANQQIIDIWESMTDAYTTLDREWRLVYTNPPSAQIVSHLSGLSPEEYLGRSHWEVFPWTVGTVIEREYRRAMTEQVAVHFEVMYEPSGDWFEVHAYPSEAGLGIYFRDISDRKRAETVTLQQLKEIEAIYTAAPIGLCFVDTDLRFVRINEYLAQIDGVSVSAHLGRTIREVLPALADQLEPLYRQVIESGEPILNLEITGKHQDSDVQRYWNVCYYPQKDANDRVLGVNAAVQEITDRKSIEADLRKREAQMQLFVKHAPAGVAMFDRDMRYVEVSDRWLTSYGLGEQDVIGRSHYDIFPEIPDRWRAIHQRCLAGAVESCEEDIFPRADGSVDWVRWEIHPWRSDINEIGGIIVFSEVITDRKQVEAALRDSEQRLQAIINNSNAVIFVKDRQGHYLLVNREYEQLFNITNDWVQGKTDYDLFPPAIAEALRENDRQVLASGKAVTLEETVPLEDGTHTYLSVKFPLFDQAGEPSALCGIATDISDRIRIETERDRLLVEAEAANRSKDEFVAMVAHELRSPLNAIQGWAKLLKTRKFDQATQNKALDTIYRNTQTQVQLVEDLLDISRMVRGTLQINFASVNLGAVLEAVLETIRPLAEAKHIQLETHLNLTPHISGDFNRLQQVAINLLTNAVKFTPTGGRVTLELEHISNQLRGNQVVLRVRDTGKGIAPEFLPQIFERFQQGQQNTGSKDGLGLGLAIVKKLVELHGGTVTVESPGTSQGATFTVQLPSLEVPAIATSQPPIAPLQTSLSGIRILVVDDEPDMLNLIMFVLQDSGAEVQAVTSVRTALDCLSQFKPNVLISDIAMPDGNGYELVQQLKSYPEGQIPTVALTAYASATYEERSLQAGFQRHLTKPVDPETLIATIVQLVTSK